VYLLQSEPIFLSGVADVGLVYPDTCSNNFVSVTEKFGFGTFEYEHVSAPSTKNILSVNMPSYSFFVNMPKDFQLACHIRGERS
jgi:hypothetical protein